MSRISGRATTIAAALAIVLLVILLVVLWTSVQRGNAGGIEAVLDEQRATYDTEQVPIGDSYPTVASVVADENFTNEVLPQDETGTELDVIAEVLPSSKGELEYITPMKLSYNQFDDPPDDSAVAKRHHTGHFRHASAEVWDTHPQYEFTAFGRRFWLRLNHDSSFASPDLKVTHMIGNTTRKEHPGHELGCYYSGVVDGDPHSAVTVNLCHGMTGHVRTSTGSYYIKPAKKWRGNDKDSLETSVQHAIYKAPARKIPPRHYDDIDEQLDTRNCGVIDYDSNDPPTPLADDSSGEKIYVGGRSRERRSLNERTSSHHYSAAERYEQFLGQGGHHRNSLHNYNRHDRYYSVERRKSYSSEEYAQDSEMESDPFGAWRPRRALPREYFIEVMVVADSKMADYHGDNWFNYILVLMSMVSRIYKDQSIGNPISIAVMKVVQTDEKFVWEKGIDGVSASAMLKNFCKWQSRHNPDEPSRDHHDVAVLLTRENLCVNLKQPRCDTLGLAEVGKMCTPSWSCAIVQDNGLSAAFTIAHEIGHVLDMSHDEDNKCDIYSDSSRVHNVMSRVLDDKTFPWEWSKCSRHYVTEFLEMGYGNCLLDKPNEGVHAMEATRLPGEDFSKNKQCELVFGRGSRSCAYTVCKMLWCTVPNSKDPNRCHTQHMPCANGTPCGDSKWCHRGECVSRQSLRPVHGKWSEWGRYGECSRTCGGGVKNKTRECNNPPPQNGGNFCVGDRVHYRSCGTKECPPGTPDFREQQCAEFNNRHVKLPNIAENSSWHSKYMKDHQYRCKLYCKLENNQSYKLGDKVLDGTPCGPDTFDICVNGQCQPAGCDHILNSRAKLDACGVCKGDNSTCQRIAGSYNTSDYGVYTRVTKIPAGSSNIDIKQHGWMGLSNDSNYLALRLGEGGKYILNGDHKVSNWKIIEIPGVIIEYSGPATVERLNSSRPIEKDLILEVLSVKHMYPPQITYEYLVPKRLLKSYTWVLSHWSKCDRLCQGMMHRKAECRDTQFKDVVSDDYCRDLQKPRDESQMCHDYCTLQWQIVSTSECSNHCGPGTRTVISKCLQILLNSDHPPRYIPDRACSHLERPEEQQSCTGPCEDAHWSYSEWSACSVTCGGGFQSRDAMCVDSKNRPVPDQSCDDQEKHTNQSCRQETCPKWIAAWSPCSVSCGWGIRHRRHWCQVDNHIAHEKHCGSKPDPVTERCDAGPCPQWHAGKWSPCSVTCGKGEKKRKVVCTNADGSPSDDCSEAEKLADTEPCEMKSCFTVAIAPIVYSPDSPSDDPSQQDNEVDDFTFRSGYEWRIKPYKPCGKPCEGGYMSVVVRCSSTESGRDAPDQYCNEKKKPHSKVPCNRRHCPVWEAGNWTQCDVKCGTGYQYRLLHCRSPHGEVLHDSECLDEEKPEVAKECRRSPCMIPHTVSHPKTNLEYKWTLSKWSHCSESCGIGVQRRRVQCTMRRDSGPEKPVNDRECSNRDIKKPKSERMCRRLACEFVWQEGAWSECSARCGHGFQNRTVTCHRVNKYGWIDPTPIEGWKCPSDKQPVSRQACRQRNCDDKFYWSVGPWKECSHSCGQRGRQTRDLYCLDRKGRTVSRRNCPSQFRPQKKQRCNQKKCASQTCRDIQRLRKNATDNEYYLYIGGKSMPIYCHGMSTPNPKEYLTLPDENYAEFYSKRLRDPGTCPYNGQRNESCDCITAPLDKPGRTKFRRVRIDPSRLYIIANDYTFSWTDGGNRVEYGRAGDCYSFVREGCPQGRFSINLNGTQLKLAPEVTWRPEPASSMQIHKIGEQQVVGRCGGYCGACRAEPGLKLDVLPP